MESEEGLIFAMLTLIFFVGLFIVSFLFATTPSKNKFSTLCVNEVNYITTDKGMTVAYSPTGKILTCQPDNN